MRVVYGRSPLQECAYPVGIGRVANIFALFILVVRLCAGPEQEFDDLLLLLSCVRCAAVAAAGILNRKMKRRGAALITAARLGTSG
jgi:hypothetical protein